MKKVFLFICLSLLYIVKSKAQISVTFGLYDDNNLNVSPTSQKICIPTTGRKFYVNLYKSSGYTPNGGYIYVIGKNAAGAKVLIFSAPVYSSDLNSGLYQLLNVYVNIPATVFSGSQSGEIYATYDDFDGSSYISSGYIYTGQTVMKLNQSQASICLWNSLNVIATGATTYSWSPSTGVYSDDIGTPTTTGSSVYLSPPTTTTYTVTGPVTGCANTAQITITILPRPTVTVSTPGPFNICGGASVTLSASTNSGNPIKWVKWNPLSAPTIGTGNSIAISRPGIYRAKTTGTNGCPNSSDFINVTSNGCRESLETLENVNEINIFPNPSNGFLTITHHNESGAMQIVDITGRTVYEYNFNTNVNFEQIDISGLSNGNYIVNIISETDVIKKQLTIIH